MVSPLKGISNKQASILVFCTFVICSCGAALGYDGNDVSGISVMDGTNHHEEVQKCKELCWTKRWSTEMARECEGRCEERAITGPGFDMGNTVTTISSMGEANPHEEDVQKCKELCWMRRWSAERARECERECEKKAATGPGFHMSNKVTTVSNIGNIDNNEEDVQECKKRCWIRRWSAQRAQECERECEKEAASGPGFHMSNKVTTISNIGDRDHNEQDVQRCKELCWTRRWSAQRARECVRACEKEAATGPGFDMSHQATVEVGPSWASTSSTDEQLQQCRWQCQNLCGKHREPVQCQRMCEGVCKKQAKRNDHGGAGSGSSLSW